MKRREFITFLGAAASASPLAANAQRAVIPVVGFLCGGGASRYMGPQRTVRSLELFHQGLNEKGYVEGRNVSVEYRWAEYQYDRFPALAADLVRRQVAAIAAIGAFPVAPAA